MNVKQWIKDLMQKPVKSIPLMTHPGIKLIGKTIKDAISCGNVHFQAIKALHERFPMADAATVIMDLTVEAEAFGAKLMYPDNDMPSVIGRVVRNVEEIEELKIPELSAGRVHEYIKANSLAARNIDKPVFGDAIGPFSLAGRLYGITEIMMAIYIEPEAIHCLMKKCTDFLIKYIETIKNTDVAGVVIAEPVAGLLSNNDCEQFSSVYVKQIVDSLQDNQFAIILHNCGNSGHCTKAMLSTGAYAYHFGNNINIVDVLKECSDDILIMGNLDPVSIFKYSDADTVYHKTKSLLERTASYPNFVLSSGCDTPPDIPFGNIDAFYRAVKEFGY